MSRESNAKEWLRKAESDRDTAKYLLAGEKYEDCTFFCQQAIEKLLKAVLVLQTDKRPPHTHDLRALLDAVSNLNSGEVEEAVSSIGGYYVGSRYPLDEVDPTIFQRPLAEAAVQKTERVFKWFLAKINFENE